MKGVSAIILIGLCASWASAQFLNHRPFPTYSLENMPDTEFSCRDKILGGYYADADTQCQMFHICVKVAGVGVQDFRFLCPNGTAFDQDHQICADWEDVDCDATTLYYSSDNFDLYRIGSGFESKAVKYGEDEETFSLQRAETGDARLNREHQAQRVNQQKQQTQFRNNKPQNRPQKANNNNNNNNSNNNNNNNDNERDIFKGSSSSNFFNNRNGGKENDEDYDDNVNVNQDQDNVQKKKLVRKQQRRPVQNDNNNQQNSRRPNQNDDQYNNNQQSNKRPVQNDDQNNNNQQSSRRPVQNDDQYNNQQNSRRPIQNDDQYNNNQQNSRKPIQNNDQSYNQNQQNRRPVQNNDQSYNQPPRRQNNDQQNRRPVNQNDQQQNLESQTTRSPRPTGFVNNFAGSSYVPTTSRPSSTTINDDQYSTAVNNHRQRNGQRQRGNGDRQYNNAENFRQTQNNSPTPTYTISTPAPFKQTQQYNSPPSRSTTQDDGKYRPTTEAPSKETENYPANFPKQPFSTTSQKFTQKQTENYPTPAPVNRNTQYNNNQYEVTKVKQNKQTENYPTQAPVTKNTQNNNQYSTQYDIPKSKPSKQTENYPTQAPVIKNTQYNNQYTTNYDISNSKPTKQTENYPTQAPVTKNTQYNTQYNSQYDVPKVKPSKQTENYPTTPFKSSDNYPTNTQFSKKPTTPVKQTDNYPSTAAPRVSKPANQASTQFNNHQRSTDNSPSTFAPRTNAAYSQISQQTTQYKASSQQQNSTPRTTPFTQYTPTVPKISSTTPVSRSNRFDETQYDDGSYDSKYDKRKNDESLSTAHSQNIANSRNEFAKTSPSTQKPHYESPRPFSVSPNTPKVTDYPKTTQKPVENRKVAAPSSKKLKDASYDYAYYDTNVGSEPEYDIDTEFKKSAAKN